MRDEINLDNAAMAGALVALEGGRVRSVRFGGVGTNGNPGRRRRWLGMGGGLIFLRSQAARSGFVLRLICLCACIVSVSRCYGDTGMQSSGGGGAEGGELVPCLVMPVESCVQNAGRRGAAESFFGKTAAPCQSVSRSAGVHRRWQPWQLRFGLREAWCCAPRSGPLGTPLGLGTQLGVSCAAFYGCKNVRWVGEELVDSSGGVNQADKCEEFRPGEAGEARGLARGEFPEHSFAGDGMRVAAPRCAVGDFRSTLAADAEARHGAGLSSGIWGASYQVCSQRVSDSGLVTCRMPSATQLVQYFGEALGESPNWQGVEVAVFQRTDCLQWGVSWRRGVVEVLPRGVGLRWLANDDFGLSELREFFEAPFFEAAETERFYRWLSEGGWHQQSLSGGVMLRMGVLRGRRATLVEISWRRGEAAFVP